MTAGQRIRIERERLGMTQEELAKKLGYAGRSTVNKVENCPNLSLKKVEEYAKALGVTQWYLLGWETKEGESLVDYEVETDEGTVHIDIEPKRSTNRKIITAYESADDLTQAMVRKLLGIE